MNNNSQLKFLPVQLSLTTTLKTFGIGILYFIKDFDDSSFLSELVDSGGWAKYNNTHTSS